MDIQVNKGWFIRFLIWIEVLHPAYPTSLCRAIFLFFWNGTQFMVAMSLVIGYITSILVWLIYTGKYFLGYIPTYRWEGNTGYGVLLAIGMILFAITAFMVTLILIDHLSDRSQARNDARKYNEPVPPWFPGWERFTDPIEAAWNAVSAKLCINISVNNDK